jgi:hypothetical protein
MIRFSISALIRSSELWQPVKNNTNPTIRTIMQATKIPLIAFASSLSLYGDSSPKVYNFSLPTFKLIKKMSIKKSAPLK